MNKRQIFDDHSIPPKVQKILEKVYGKNKAEKVDKKHIDKAAKLDRTRVKHNDEFDWHEMARDLDWRIG